MKTRIVLDAAAFDTLDRPEGVVQRALIRSAAARDVDICTTAVTVAEVCRGAARTKRVEASLTRRRAGRKIDVVPTDLPLAKLVGAILHEAKADSTMIADAHVVAVCAAADLAIVVTADPDDITHLAGALRGVRVVTRKP